jgi:predicted MFS family arabinose efflux permease
MIAGLLPGMAADLGVSIGVAGQLVTVFALAYALGSPVLAALTGNLNRRRLLIGAMTLFALANLLAFTASGYWSLMATRVVLALAAAVYVPGVNALASVVVPAEQRGRAIAIVNGGLSLAIALGVPAGTVLGTALGWRATFVSVALLSALAVVGLLVGLPREIGASLATASLRQRVSTAAQPAILITLLITTLWAMASYTTYTYLAPLLEATTQIHGSAIGFVLFGWGVSAAIGLAISGPAVDRKGPRAVILPALATSTTAFIVLSLAPHFADKQIAIVPIVLCIVAWGVAHWAFYPVQQTTLVGVAGMATAPVALSLNASFMYLGFSLGAGLGSLTLRYSSLTNLGFVSALCAASALILAYATGRQPVPQPSPSN